MSVFVGDGTTGVEARADRLGLPTGTTDPATAEAGDLYYKTDTNKIRVYDGSAWADLASGGGGGGSAAYTIDNSVRFDSASSSYLSRTPSAGNRKTWTWAGWVKLNKVTSSQMSVFNAKTGSGNANTGFDFDSAGTIRYVVWNGSGVDAIVTTTQVFRDFSGWYHLVFAVDTTQATAENRVKLYVNGSQVTSFSATIYPTQNYEAAINLAQEHNIGRSPATAAAYGDFYLADIHFIDGSALAPTAFGEFDATTGVWNPIEYTGSYPGNSFHLDFSNGSTAAALGTDVSGAGNNWSVNNLVSAVDNNRYSQTTTGTAPTPYSTNSGSYVLAFDGDTITGFAWTPGTWAMDWTGLSSAVTVSSSLRIFCYPRLGTLTVNINGSNVASITGNTVDWRTISFTGTINTISFNGTDTYSSVYAIEVDGSILVDYQVNGKNVDSFVDSPTNGTASTGGDPGGSVVGNYATLNPLHSQAATFSNGNLQFTTSSIGKIFATIGISSGKWYWESQNLSSNSLSSLVNGVGLITGNTSTYGGGDAGDYAWLTRSNVSSPSSAYNNGSATSYGNVAVPQGAIVGTAFDADNGILEFFVDGVSQGVAWNNIPVGSNLVYAPISGDPNSSTNTDGSINFGQRPFAYQAPAGYLSLNTANLPTPTIANPVDAVGALIWTGTATGGNRTIGPDTDYMNFTPDLVWSKSYNGNEYHNNMWDSVRGFISAGSGVGALVPDLTLSAEGAASGGYVSAVGSGTITYSPEGSGSSYEWYDQDSSHDYIARCWNAGSTTVTGYQPSGATVACNYRANTDAGFSIISYTGPAGTSDHFVGHGLTKAPEFIITKNRDTTFNWDIYHYSLGDTESFVFSNAAQRTVNAFRNQDPTALLFGVGYNFAIAPGNAYIAYAWHSVDGLSSFGSYIGTGSADGPYYHCGFRPQLVIIKGAAASSQWFVHDDTRIPERTDGNPSTKEMAWESAQVQYDTVGVGAGERLDILSNGFKARTTNGACNSGGVKYCVMAWARSPFKYARAR